MDKTEYCPNCHKEVETFPVTVAIYGPDFGKTKTVCKVCKLPIRVG